MSAIRQSATAAYLLIIDSTIKFVFRSIFNLIRGLKPTNVLTTVSRLKNCTQNNLKMIGVKMISLTLIVSMLTISTQAVPPDTGVLTSIGELGQNSYSYLSKIEMPDVPAMAVNVEESLPEYSFLFNPILSIITGTKIFLKSRHQQRINRIEVSPNYSTIREGEQINFTAVAYDAQNNLIQGVPFEWSAADTAQKLQPFALPEGRFEPSSDGEFKINAQVGGISGTTLVMVIKDPQLRAQKELDVQFRASNDEKALQALRSKPLPDEVKAIMAQPRPAPINNSLNMTPMELQQLQKWDQDNKARLPIAAPGNPATSSSGSTPTKEIGISTDSEVRYLVNPEDSEKGELINPSGESKEPLSNSFFGYIGTLDAINTTTGIATGWALNDMGSGHYSIVSLSYYIDGVFVGSGYAATGSGCPQSNSWVSNCYFSFTIPSQYFNGVQHTFSAQASGVNLPNSPRTFTLSPAVNPNWNNQNFPTADDPGVQPGAPPANGTGGAGSGNFGFSAPVLSLSGRSGLDVNLALDYNSLLWHQAGTNITYDIDKGYPAPGWNIGFGKIMDMDSSGGSMLETPDGTRHDYEGTLQAGGAGSSTYYGRTVDGSFIDYVSYRSATGISAATAYLPNGTIITYGASISTIAFPTQIKDRNGNYITITYVNNTGPNISTITDTLGRVITFNYDSSNRLISITGPGYNGATRTFVRLHYKTLSLTNATFSSLTKQVGNSTPNAIDAIYYPTTNTGYWFGDADSYSSYGMLNKVIEERGMSCTSCTATSQGTINAGTTTRQMVYNYPMSSSNLTTAPLYTQMTESWSNMDVTPAPITYYSVNNTSSPRTTTITLPDQTVIKQSSYNNSTWSDGLPYQVEKISPSPASVTLSKTVTTWAAGEYNSPRPTEVDSYDEKNQMTKQLFYYANNLYNQVTSTEDYGYSSNLLRKKVNTYENSAGYTGTYSGTVWQSGRHIFSLVTTEQLQDASSVPQSRVNYTYDGATLTNTPSVTSYDQTYNPSSGTYVAATGARGNVTRVSTFSDAATPSGQIDYDSTYDITGNALTTTTDCCQQMSFVYSTATQYSQPDSHTKGSSTVSSPDRMTESATYDFNSGAVTSSTNFNGRTTNYTYDAVTRLVQTDFPTTGRQTTVYDDANSKLTGTLYDKQGATYVIANQSTNFYNGRGQVYNSGQFVGGTSWNAVATQYDNMGRKWKVSLPYDTTGSPSQWTTIAYDALSRVIQTTAPDSSTTKSFYNETGSRPDSASAALGQTIRMQDAWGRERWARTDDWGRTVEVVEPNPTGNGAVIGVTGSLQTTYAYDVKDQLTNVTQGSQTRWFAYDSLGRLVRQKLAEQAPTINASGSYVGAGGSGAQWSDAFAYDARSNLTQRTDARGVITTFSYQNGGVTDPLNRLQSVSYNTSTADTTFTINAAPTVSMTYATSGDKTRVVTVTSVGVATETNGYDTEGRIGSYTLTFANRSSYPLTTSYIYDTVNRLAQVTYPAQYGVTGNPQKTINPTYDNASRLAQLSVGGQLQMSEIYYNPMSQVTSLKTGAATANPDVEQYTYDASTALLTNQKVTRASTSQVLLNLDYDYSRGGSNGSLNYKTGQLTHITNVLDPNKNRTYEFDALGRLKTAKGGLAAGATGVTANWTQSYAYDRYGNRPTVTASGITQNSQTVPTDGLASLSFDATSNRINTSGYQYDLAGNLIRGQKPDGTWQRYEYDAAGRLVKIKDDSNNLLETYTYGADRNRLINEAAGSQRTYYVWGGQSVLCEYVENPLTSTTPVFSKSYIYAGSRLLSTQTNNSGTETTLFQHPDRTGTKLVTNPSNATQFEQSTLPFGTDMTAETTGTTNQRFTSYDRSVSGIDYAVNRAYTSGQSRFMQVDPIGMGATNQLDPQSNNLYAYTQNNPVDFIDPSGLNEEPIRIETWAPAWNWGFFWLVMFGSGNNGGIGDPGGGGGGGGGHSRQDNCKQALDQAGKTAEGLSRALQALDNISAQVGDTNFAKLLVAIGIQETDFKNIDQFGGGPGRGVYQIEPKTYGITEAEANDPALAANAIATELGKTWGNELNALSNAGFNIQDSKTQYWALAGLARTHNRGSGGVVSVNKNGPALGSLLQSGLNSGNVGDLDNAGRKINKNLKETAHGTYVKNVMNIFFSCLNG